MWFQNGESHRLDGPAIECSNGDKSYWIEGARYPSKKAFEKQIALLNNQVKMIIILVK